MHILVAMSGGVDSAAAAILLRDQGHSVAGATMLLAGTAEAEAARATCDQLGIDFYPLDFRAQFARDVIEPFCARYRMGWTPNPCVFCNRALKFGAFLDWALAHGFDAIATGHYARRIPGDPITLHRARDAHKDQTYMLYQLTQAQLAHVYFPLGELTKADSRAIAAAHGLAVAHKHDSQDICFIPDGDYAAYLCAQGRPLTPGNFRDFRTGAVLGPHAGAERYTIGQRKGLGIALGARAYVVKKAGPDVYLGTNDDLYTTSARVLGLHFLDGAPPTAQTLSVKLRYSARLAACTLTPTETGGILTFDQPQRAVTPGQSAVLYDGDRLLGGGILAEAQ